MGADEVPLTIGQLIHHPGMHVSVNLQGKTVGGVGFDAEHWVSGVIIGSGPLGAFVTVQLDEPIGATPGQGLFHHGSKGEDKVAIDDPYTIRPKTLDEVAPDGVPPEIADLARRGKTLEAIRRYRALNGASLDEARAAIDALVNGRA